MSGTILNYWCRRVSKIDKGCFISAGAVISWSTCSSQRVMMVRHAPWRLSIETIVEYFKTKTVAGKWGTRMALLCLQQLTIPIIIGFCSPIAQRSSSPSQQHALQVFIHHCKSIYNSTKAHAALCRTQFSDWIVESNFRLLASLKGPFKQYKFDVYENKYLIYVLHNNIDCTTDIVE